MATTITEFIEYLQTLPEETEIDVVCCIEQDQGYFYDSTPMVIGENTKLYDFRDGTIKDKSNKLYGKVILSLGDV